MLKLADSMTWDDTVAFGQYSTGAVLAGAAHLNRDFAQNLPEAMPPRQTRLQLSSLVISRAAN
jgi:hypothetical protein